MGIGTYTEEKKEMDTDQTMKRATKLPSGVVPKFISKLALQRSESPERGSTQASDMSMDAKDTEVTGRRGGMGVIAATTSNYYLVRCKGEWVAVRFQDLFDEHGNPIDPSTPFAQLKNHPVLLKRQGTLAKACLFKGEDNLPTLRPTIPRSKDDNDTETSQSLMKLARELCEDVTSLSLAQDSNPQVVSLLLNTVRRRLSEDLPSLIERVEGRGEKEAKTAKKLRLFVKNVGEGVSHCRCDLCSRSKAAYILSCGHRICTFCLRRKRCSLCGKALAHIDEKLTAGLV